MASGRTVVSRAAVTGQAYGHTSGVARAPGRAAAWVAAARIGFEGRTGGGSMELALERVTRLFDERTALDEVSFRSATAGRTGFVGANGAGKTTAMRIVMGVLAPDVGGRHVRWSRR